MSFAFVLDFVIHLGREEGFLDFAVQIFVFFLAQAVGHCMVAVTVVPSYP